MRLKGNCDNNNSDKKKQWHWAKKIEGQLKLRYHDWLTAQHTRKKIQNAAMFQKK